MSNILDEESMERGSGISANAQQQLLKIGTWTRITSICGIIIGVVIALFLVYLLIMLSSSSRTMMIGVVVFVVGLVALAFGGFLMYLLMQVSKNTTRFAQTQEPSAYAEATSKRKIYWIITGVLSIFGILSSLWSLVQLLSYMR